MMPAVMMAPMVAAVMRGAIITDLARAIGGRHKATARPHNNGGIIVRVPIIIGVIVVIDASKKDAMPVPETTAGETRTTGNMAYSRTARGERRSRTERTAANASATEAMTSASAAAAAVTVNFNR
jgi:hypothetical protein